jgi:mRNA interferase HigB
MGGDSEDDGHRRTPDGTPFANAHYRRIPLLPIWEQLYWFGVRIIARRTLREFWEKHADAEQPLRAWYHDVRKADWQSPADVKRVYANASIVGDDRLVFNIGGNKYRLVVAVNYRYRICYVRFVGTHKAYDRIDVATV